MNEGSRKVSSVSEQVVNKQGIINDTRNQNSSSSMETNVSNVAETKVDAFQHSNSLIVEESENLPYWKINKKVTGTWFAILSTVFSFATVFLIPYHNVFVHPEFIWEAPFLHWFPYLVMTVAFKMYLCSVVMEYPAIISPKVLINLILTAWIVTTIVYSLQYCVWTLYFRFYQPVAQGGALNAITVIWTIGVTFYFQFPAHLRADSRFRKRIIWFIVYWEWVYHVPLQFMFVSSTVQVLGEYIWVVAFIFIVILETNKFIMESMILKACGENEADAKRINIIQLYGQYIFAVVTMISAGVDDFTSYLILGMDFALNLVTVFKIIRSQRKVGLSEEQNAKERMYRELETKELILGEAIECIVPMIFMGGFAIAFYGPNYDKLGNVGFDYFQYTKVTDILDYLNGALYMTSIDVTCSIITILLLWFGAGINMVKESVEVAKKYGKITSWFLIEFLIGVS